MEYKKLKDTWTGMKPFNLSGKSKEEYAGPVTLSLSQWRDYVASGKNVLYGSGGIIPNGTDP